MFIAYRNSITRELNLRTNVIDGLKSSRDSLDNGYKKLIKNYKEENNSKIQNATQNLQNLQNAYDEQKKLYDELADTLKAAKESFSLWVNFVFGDEKNKPVEVKDGRLTIVDLIKRNSKQI